MPSAAYVKYQSGDFPFYDLDSALRDGLTDHEYLVILSGHDFTQARFTGNTICVNCNLVPLDDEDMETECSNEV